jgi:hypothetical protein
LAHFVDSFLKRSAFIGILLILMFAPKSKNLGIRLRQFAEEPLPVIRTLSMWQMPWLPLIAFRARISVVIVKIGKVFILRIKHYDFQKSDS